jgi:antitoxin component HigA of HigAB toxin-antitoxin module
MNKIETKQQYYEAMAVIESYLQKGFSNLSDTEDSHLNELSRAVEIWEMKEYPMPLKPDFKAILLYIMAANHFNQSQLSSELGISKSQFSEILSGRKSPNVTIVKQVHDRFHIDGNLLLDSL